MELEHNDESRTLKEIIKNYIEAHIQMVEGAEMIEEIRKDFKFRLSMFGKLYEAFDKI